MIKKQDKMVRTIASLSAASAVDVDAESDGMMVESDEEPMEKKPKNLKVPRKTR
jgi:hypothetical protein